MMRIQIREEAGIRRATPEIPEWWATIPEGEKMLLHAIARLLRSAKRSQLQEVARAAAKWERGIGCFVKVRLMWEKRKAENRKQKSELGWQPMGGGCRRET